MMTNPAEHVKDTTAFELPFGVRWEMPQLWGFQLTKFMVVEVLAAVLMGLIFFWISRRIASGRPPRGRLWNLFEAMLLFIRDQVVRPSIGPPREADRYLPFIWTLFFFILFCNLLGLVPWLGSPTGAFEVTGTLALCSFFTLVGAGMWKFGPIRFWLGLCPHMDLPLPMKIVLTPVIWAIEFLGLLIKHTILAVRLLANMFAGHMVLAVIVGFIAAAAPSMFWPGVTLVSLLFATALNVLELFIAFLQAYIFAFLTSLFIGMALHPH
jgi:F-type H+-transporting ATPase subunit a